jgi:DNA-binding GntR family transcriptional regulator
MRDERPFWQKASRCSTANKAINGEGPFVSGISGFSPMHDKGYAEAGLVGEGRRRVKSNSSSEKENRSKREGKVQESPVDVAFRKIKEMMYRHEIVPGQKLLYHELARRLNMSITPIIQALNRLQLLNIVYSERNRGYYVGEADPVEARELFIAREALETYLVPSIVKNLTDKRLNAVEKAMKEHTKGLSMPQYGRILMIRDTNFHLKIIECSENKVVYNMCKLIFEQIYLKYRPEFMREPRLRRAADEHEMILACLRERDVRKTRRLIRQHIRNGSAHIVSSLLEDKNVEF